MCYGMLALGMILIQVRTEITLTDRIHVEQESGIAEIIIKS